ncbi:unnamed protein product [Meloidogyne enterolobii]|uniref:Uncharacterized protein n=1 Tax=Meloidogyne enterolobii TaxID=390850 RepID=A0ACB1A4W7_MELEN
MVPKLLRYTNFSGSYGFAPTWPCAYLDVSRQIDGYSRLACICFYSSCYWVAYEVESLRLIDDDSLLDNF